MTRRSDMLELAILGLLHDTPMHGYEVRKQVHRVLGTVRAMSYGTLYPRLRLLVERGLIVEQDASPTGRRARITYAVTPAGQERFQSLLTTAGPSAWEDDAFAVHFAFFGRADRAVRLRILEGRRARLEERLAMYRANGLVDDDTLDGYAAELHRHGLESAERDVRWLTGLIETERSAGHRGVAQHEE
ncbi:PadR family transcriptional regulator [Ornithinimicrobium faecis]|uniref:PadR family transcriptional regulator n=1 Tax=Ornithinimicrobium faecis TaxID=2934158 RepID=A0ABY4YUC1_9MICO|nr:MULTISPECIES: PadR family transcriptional regulator [unclassified Ornithinimicrobium]USQ80070.1 PadR family transcriptional regulator [Ornithinimicrobium sp. HY1793]